MGAESCRAAHMCHGFLVPLRPLSACVLCPTERCGALRV